MTHPACRMIFGMEVCNPKFHSQNFISFESFERQVQHQVHQLPRNFNQFNYYAARDRMAVLRSQCLKNDKSGTRQLNGDQGARFSQHASMVVDHLYNELPDDRAAWQQVLAEWAIISETLQTQHTKKLDLEVPARIRTWCVDDANSCWRSAPWRSQMLEEEKYSLPSSLPSPATRSLVGFKSRHRSRHARRRGRVSGGNGGRQRQTQGPR
eukprot:767561-Hanusia_phi.AAC.9